MRHFTTIWASLLIALLGTIGCSKHNDKKSTVADPASISTNSETAPHAHGTGPNGGIVFDLGNHHAEFTVDHPKHECTILVLGDDEKTSTAIVSEEFILSTKETKTAEGKVIPSMTITMKPVDTANGKATKFVGSDPGIGNVADFAGTVSGEIDSKPVMGEFEE